MDTAQLLDTARAVGGRLLRADVKGLRRLLRVNSMFHPQKVVKNFSSTKALFETVSFQVDPAKASPLNEASKARKQEFSKILKDAGFGAHKYDRQLTAFMALQKGAILFENYYQDTAAEDLRIGWSVSKGLIALLVGILIDKKQIQAAQLDQPVTPLVPLLVGSGYEGVTLRNLLNMSSGVEFNEDYIDYHSDINKMGRILGVGGSMDAFAATLKREFTPNTWRHYVSIDTHVIGMALRALTGRPIADLYQEYLIAPMGFQAAPHCITDSLGEAFVLGGFNFCTRDFARIGEMMRRVGKWNGKQIVSAKWIEQVLEISPLDGYPKIQGTPDNLSDYGMHWWRPENAEEGEFYAIGIYGQMIYVNRNSDLVLVQNATDLNFRDGNGIVAVETLKFYRRISDALRKT